jgi:GDSL-like lipase/acylhydrolase family protein
MASFNRAALITFVLLGGVACDEATRLPTDLAAPDAPPQGPASPDSLPSDPPPSDSTLPDSTPADSAISGAVVRLVAPQQLLASALSTSQVRLSWKDASTSESGFEISRSLSGSAGPYTLISTLAPNVKTYSNSALSRGRTYCYRVRAKAGGGAASSPNSNQVCTATMSGTAPPVRVITFGDSNTDWGVNGADPEVLARSYLSDGSYLAAMAANSSDQLAGKIEIQWRAVRSNAVRAVNHAIGGTTTGGGSFGGPNRHFLGAPQARTVVSGITRFEGEVLGLRWPWSGGEPATTKYTNGPIRRVQAFTPAANDFVYVSMGTNDPASRISTQQTLANLSWMIDRWRAAGRRADHVLLTTLAPRTGTLGASFPAINNGIRALASSKGVILIDLANHTSRDNGRTWRSSSLHVGDGLHYSESVRDWLASQVVAEMRKRVP